MPKLRFPEFNGEWKEKTLADIAKITGGGTPSTDNPSYWNGSLNWYTPSEVGKNKYISSSERKLTALGLKNSSAKILPSGTILLSSRATIGEMSILKTEATTNQGFQSLIVNKNSLNEFIYYLGSTFKNILIKNASGSTFLEISKKEVSKINVNMPSLPEQQKIASFLSKVDSKIDLLKKKLELWETYKKGIMQQIFSQKLRFKDENGEDYPDWEEGKIKDILVQEIRKIEKPKTGYWRLGLRSHAKGTFHEFIEDPTKIAMDYLFLVKENDLILNITFAWEHAIALASKEDNNKLVSHRFPTYKFFEGINPFFYKYYVTLPKFKYELENISPGGAGRNRVMRKAEFLDIRVPIPTAVEQTKIANLLSVVYNKIDELKKELEIIKEFKKGLLQQMFC